MDTFVRDEVRESREHANKINCTANIELLEKVQAISPSVKVIFFSSIPSSFIGKGHEPPEFYRGVAESKSAFELRMHQLGESQRALEMTIISGGVIEDSIVGRLIANYIAPLLSEEEKGRLTRGYIRNENMVEAALRVLRGEIIRGDDNPKTIFVIGEGEIVDEVSDDDPVFAFNGLNFAELAKRL